MCHRIDTIYRSEIFGFQIAQTYKPDADITQFIAERAVTKVIFEIHIHGQYRQEKPGCMILPDLASNVLTNIFMIHSHQLN